MTQINEISDWILVEEPSEQYIRKDLIHGDKCYEIIGACFEVHNALGKGFLEAVYKDALEVEFQVQAIPYEREKKYEIIYKGVKLPRFYTSDFVVWDDIVLEIKASTDLIDAHVKQTLNYLAASKCKLGIIANFGEDKLKFKRVVL